MKKAYLVVYKCSPIMPCNPTTYEYYSRPIRVWMDIFVFASSTADEIQDSMLDYIKESVSSLVNKDTIEIQEVYTLN